MVVDDDRTLLKLYEIILAGMGDHSVEFSMNGKDAIDNFRRHTEKPKVIITNWLF